MPKTFDIEVTVNYDLSWGEAIRRGAPNTTPDRPSLPWKIWDIAKAFPNSQKGIVREKLTILNFQHREGKYIKQAMAYGEKQKLPVANPRAVFAIGEHFLEITNEWQRHYMKFVSSRGCLLQRRASYPSLIYGESWGVKTLMAGTITDPSIGGFLYFVFCRRK